MAGSAWIGWLANHPGPIEDANTPSRQLHPGAPAAADSPSASAVHGQAAGVEAALGVEVKSANETATAAADRVDELPAPEPSAEFRPSTRQEIFDARRRALRDSGDYAGLARFEAKAAYEGERRALQQRQREQLKALDQERSELRALAAETADPSERARLRASAEALRRERHAVRQAFVEEKRLARRALGQVSKN